MPASLDGRLVVAISSRALFDFEEENRLFEGTDDRAYMDLQLDRIEVPAKPGVAFSLVRKLLAFNAPGRPRVEVVILSRNDPVSGMRVFRSAQHYGLPIQRGSFTRGQSPWRYLRPLNANLFLSTHLADVRSALEAGVPAARVLPHAARAVDAHPHEVRIAFDGDAVRFQLRLPARQFVLRDRESDVQRARAVVARNAAAVRQRDCLGSPTTAEDQQHAALGDAVGAQPLVLEDRLQFEDAFVEGAGALHVIGVKRRLQNAVELGHGALPL